MLSGGGDVVMVKVVVVAIGKGGTLSSLVRTQIVKLELSAYENLRLSN